MTAAPTMQHRPDLHELVRDLTQVRTHRIRPDHSTIACLVQMPSLLDQLAAAIRPSNAIDAGRPGYQSNASARLEAVATRAAITDAANHWLTRLHAASLGTAQAQIRKLYALSPQLNRDTLDELTDDIRTWWTWARFATGWDSPPFTPNNTCPHCGERGGLRVRIDDRLATCVECRATWSHASIGILGEHIRHENGEDPAMTITEFLNACIDEDESWALDTAGPSYDEPHDPGAPGHHARVLADIQAKRRILALHSDDDGNCRECGFTEAASIPTPWPCATVLLLATPHAAHPDYNPTWSDV